MTYWDDRYLEIAGVVASWSKDSSTKVGCVVVGPVRQILATGYNGFPRGVDDDVPERWERPEKYLWVEHAERNAIYNAARSGISLAGATMYVERHPCADCARGIIQSGISCVVVGSPVLLPRWEESCTVAGVMFEESGVAVLYTRGES